jgi:hypothetical protein
MKLKHYFPSCFFSSALYVLARLEALNGPDVESMQAKWEEMFGETKEEVIAEVKVKKPVAKKP